MTKGDLGTKGFIAHTAYGSQYRESGDEAKAVKGCFLACLACLLLQLWTQLPKGDSTHSRLALSTSVINGGERSISTAGQVDEGDFLS